MAVVITRTLVERSRAAVAASRESIARSRVRIVESLGIIEHYSGIAIPAWSLSDEEQVELSERWQAMVNQREIDCEMRRSMWGEDPSHGVRSGFPARR